MNQTKQETRVHWNLTYKLGVSEHPRSVIIGPNIGAYICGQIWFMVSSVLESQIHIIPHHNIQDSCTKNHV